jgi:hypothetical protein
MLCTNGLNMFVLRNIFEPYEIFMELYGHLVTRSYRIVILYIILESR